jgi:hypothetical protein
LGAAAILSIAGCSDSNSGGNPIAEVWHENEAAEQIDHAQFVEPLLEAAGFTRREADTPDKVTHLESLTPYRIRYHLDPKGIVRYHFADPDFCRCVYVGDEANYQKYQKLKADKLAQNSGMLSQAAIDSINQDQLSQEVGLPQFSGFDSVWGP